MPVTETEMSSANGEARTPAARKILKRLADAASATHFGQPPTTLSGGKRQRLKLAVRLGEKGGVCRSRQGLPPSQPVGHAERSVPARSVARG